MLTSVANHLWQSTVFAAIACLLALSLRRYRAQTRHWIWLIASVKFLVPFSLLTNLGSLFPAGGTAQPPRVAVVMQEFSQPFTGPVFAPDLPAPIRGAEPILPALLLALWLAGSVAVLAVWLVRWLRIRAAVRVSEPLPLEAPVRVMASSTLLEPGVFGIFRPVLLLPQGIWNRLAPQQFSAILAHELCHVRRRDNLAAAIHMVVEALFWFHPPVWFLGARMVDERERACDEEVLRQGSQPEVYAEGILNVCKFYLQSPLACAAGVSGADLRKRIEAIMTNRISPALTLPRRALILAAAAAAVVVPVLIGMWNAPRGLAQSQDKLVFEVASIKPVDRSTLSKVGIGLTPGGGIRGAAPLKTFITWAYKIGDFQLSGGPSWIASDFFEIQAKPEKFEGPDDPAILPSEQQTERTRERMKALLAERFRLVVRAESKEASVYVLSVGKGGHKLKAAENARNGVRQNNGEIISMGSPIRFFVPALSRILGRPVLDETGLTGEYDFKLEFRPESFVPAEKFGVPIPAPDTSEDPRPSIFTAVQQQLGLKLDARKGPVNSIVIESVEKPSGN